MGGLVALDLASSDAPVSEEGLLGVGEGGWSVKENGPPGLMRMGVSTSLHTPGDPVESPQTESRRSGD